MLDAWPQRFKDEGTARSIVQPRDGGADPAGKTDEPTELGNLAFLGNSVESGSATAVVIATGKDTYLGSMARSISEAHRLLERGSIVGKAVIDSR